LYTIELEVEGMEDSWQLDDQKFQISLNDSRLRSICRLTLNGTRLFPQTTKVTIKHSRAGVALGRALLICAE
jgi:hypothetical protein